MREVIEKNVTVILPTCNRYQTARLVAAQKLIPKLTVVEISGVGSYNIPGWRAPEADRLPFVETLFRDKTFGEIKSAILRQKLHAHLSERKANIDSLAVLGWGNREALCGLAWAVQHQVPSITFSDSHALFRVRPHYKEWPKKRIVALFSSALVAGQSHRAYMEMLGMPSDRIFDGYNVVDNDYFAQGAEAMRADAPARRQACGLSRPCFLVPARFIWQKNLPRLVEAYARYHTLCKRYENPSAIWDLALMGDGPLGPEIDGLIERYHLQEHIHRLGFAKYDELPLYYGISSALILPSISETWGLVVNEAMACGLPVLVSNRCGCAADLVKDGVNGFTFDPFNVEEMAKCMAKLSSLDADGLSSMASASRKTINQWGPERFTDGLLSATRKALDEGPRENSFTQNLLLRLLLRK